MEWIIEKGRIYSNDEKGEIIAEATFYQTGEGKINVNHVYVNPVYRGQSMAGKVMKAIAEHLREEGIKATATCSYACAWFDKNEEAYSDILVKSDSKQGPSCEIDGKH